MWIGFSSLVGHRYFYEWMLLTAETWNATIRAEVCGEHLYINKVYHLGKKSTPFISTLGRGCV